MRTFEEVKADQPQEGDILESLTGRPVVLSEESREEGDRLKKGVFCRAVASVEQDGWYLSDQGIGLVCLVLPESQKRLSRNENKKLTVMQLRAVRYTANKKALLCEVP